MSWNRSASNLDETGTKVKFVKGVSGAFFRLLLLVFVAGLGAMPAAWAQAGFSSGTVRGTVFDSQGAVIPNAMITVRNPATGITRSVTSSGEGAYQVPLLNPGTYSITVEAPGFGKLVADEVVVTVGQVVAYDAHLTIGATATVEVNGNSAPLIDTAQAQQANTINQVQEVNLPNISRNFAQTIFTVPGIADSTAPSVQDPNVGTGYASSGFSIGGGNGRSNLFTIDGGENDAGSGAQRVPHVPQDSVQEFQVNRNSFAAEFGFTVGSAINVLTKSGTNKFHGDAFVYFHDRSTDATNYFNSFGATAGTKPFEQSVIYGGSVGGPIKKDKLFFFTSYERQKLDSAVTTSLINTAQAQGVQGQANGFTGTSCPAPVTQACYLAQVRAAGILTATNAGTLSAQSPLYNPINDPLFRALITPNDGTFDGNANVGAVQAAPNANGRYNNWVSRLDYQPNQTNNLSLRFSFSRESNQVIGAGGVPRFTSIGQTIRDYTITASWDHTFNANIVNTVRVQVVPFNNVNNVAPHGGAEFDLGSLGVQGTPFDFPYNQLQNQYQFDDDLAITKHNHNLKFGESYRPVQYNIFQAFLFGGQYQYFDGAVPIIGLQDPATQGALVGFNLTHGYAATGPASTNFSASQLYVAGLPLAVLQGGGNGQYTATTNPIGFYAQDSWKATHNLTLNYGGRLDIDPQPNGYPLSFFGSPRAGVAWDARGDGKTVVRAGGGLFTAPTVFIVPFTSTTLNGDGNHIFASAITATQPNGIARLAGIGGTERFLAAAAGPSNPNPGLTPAQFTTATGGANGGVVLQRPGPNQQEGAFFSVSPNFKSQYSVQASASVAQEIAPNLSLELGYLYYHGVHIQQIQEGNFAIDPTQAVDPFIGPQYAPLPGSTFGTPNTQIVQNDVTTSSGESSYNALTASLTKRLGHGLQFQINYTFSRSIDNTSDFSSQSTPFRPGLLGLDRAESDFNIKHNFVASANYLSPVHKQGSSLLTYLYSDFIVSPIVSVRSGVPFTALVPGIASNGTGGAHTSEARPYHEGRNQGVGPGYGDWDLRISRKIPLKRDSPFNLEAIAQSANVLNHTNFTSVQNIFPPTATTNAAGQTTSALVPTQEGTVDLLNGPYNFKGFRPVGAAQLTSPLAFKTAAIPRQISFGLQLNF